MALRFARATGSFSYANRMTLSGAAAESKGPAPSPYFLTFPASIHFCVELSFLSVRCVQPIQQHGRRSPSFSCTGIRSICSLRVSAFFTYSTQQIHSLRASGVRLSQSASASLSAVRAFFTSAGEVPLEIEGRSKIDISVLKNINLTRHGEKPEREKRN